MTSYLTAFLTGARHILVAPTAPLSQTGDTAHWLAIRHFLIAHPALGCRPFLSSLSSILRMA